MSFRADRFGSCFAKVTPPRSYTFSEREVPCRFEYPLPAEDGGGGAKRGGIPEECPFHASGYCQRIESDQVLQKRLVDAYSEPIKCVLSENSTSVVIRSEQQFHRQDFSRFTQRRHFYEVVGFGGRPERFGVHCTKMEAGDRFGEYLGFVDLRLHYSRNPLAFGLLVEPSWIREEPHTFVIKGDYGPLFGAHSFRSSVFAMQDPKTAGANCAQMCAIMALGMLSDRGADIKGSFTLTYLAWQHSGKTAGSPNSLRGDVGLRPGELSTVLSRCRVQSHWYRFRTTSKTPGGTPSASRRKFVIRIIEANIYARFPVILAVDTKTWWPGGSQDEGHAVTIIGIRKHAADSSVAAFVLHDPGSGPFVSFRTDRVLTAAEAYANGGSVHFVTATENNIARQASSCLEWLLAHEKKRPDIPHRFSDFARGTANCEDYEIRLLNKNTILRHVALLNSESKLSERQKESIDQMVRELPDSRFWVVTGLRQSETQGRFAVSVIWVFDAIRENNMPPLTGLYRMFSNEQDTFIPFKL